MKVNFDPSIKEINELKAIPAPGAYALEAEILEWIKCRDHIRKKLDPDTFGFFFSHRPEPEQPAAIAAFLTKTELILGIEDGSKFRNTTRYYATWIEPSRFWMGCWMRRSLLTILLRCGMEYDCNKDNFDDALFNQEYIKTTKNAITRFLYGFTKYDGPGEQSIGWGATAVTGWWNVFHNQPDESVRRYLVKPPEKESDSCIIGIGTLWA